MLIQRTAATSAGEVYLLKSSCHFSHIKKVLTRFYVSRISLVVV